MKVLITGANGFIGSYMCDYFLNNNTTDNSDMTLSDSKMTILGNGNVGIGTTSPGTYLQLGDYPSENISQTSYPDILIHLYKYFPNLV